MIILDTPKKKGELKMGWFDWIGPAVDAVKAGIGVVNWVKEKAKKFFKWLSDSGEPTDKDGDKPNTKFNKILAQIREEMLEDAKEFQEENIHKIKSSVEDFFENLIDKFENMDISRLESMLNDTIEKNQAKVDEIIKDEISYDNDELREIANCKSKEDRDEKYENFFAELEHKIERQQRKNIRKLYNETLNNAHDAYDEEYEKESSIIDTQIKDISRMITDNDNQSESEEVLIDNIQKKIICQMAIDAVESVN